MQRLSAGQLLALLAILGLALGLRLWGAFADLPYIYHPDEPQNIVAIQEMLANRDPNPHLFLYPSLLYYVNALAAIVHALPAWLSGASPTFAEPISIAMGATLATDPDAVALYRSMTICSGVLSVLLVYLIGRRARDVRTGLLAALLAAISPILAADCRHVTSDSYVVLFELFAILASLAIADGGRRLSYVAAGIATGAAAASKYNGAIVCVFPLVAHLLRCGFDWRASAPLWIAAVSSIAAFFCLSPYVLLDYEAFMGVIYQYRMYSGHHHGMEGNAPWWYLGVLWTSTGVASLLALGQVTLAWRRRCVATTLLAGFALPYFVFISSFSLRNERTLLPIVPCVLLLAAMCLTQMWTSPRLLPRISPALRAFAIATVGMAALLTPLFGTIKAALALTTQDSRATAREWINATLPEHSVVAVESYAPFVSPVRFRIVESERAIDHVPQWYVGHVDYVVLSQGTFGRYFADPQLYAAEVLRYSQLVQSLKLVRRFVDGGYEIAVYATGKVPPGEPPASG